MAIFIVLFLLIVASAVLCHYIAKSRDGNARYWGFMGALFGPLAVPFAFFARSVARSVDSQENFADASESDAVERRVDEADVD